MEIGIARRRYRLGPEAAVHKAITKLVRRPVGFELTAIDERSGLSNENHDLGSGFSRGGRNKKWKVFGNGWGASF